MLSGRLLASLTDALSAFHCSYSSCTPTNSIRTRNAAFPSGMRIAVHKFRLPFGHAGTTAKEPVAMKVAGCSTELISAPVADFRHLITARRVRLTLLAFKSAGKRAVSLIQTPAACGFFAALLAYRFLVNAPSCGQKAFAGAMAAIGPSSLRIELVFAMVAVSHFLCSHSAIISRFIELERKYCDIAIERLRQRSLFSVLPSEMEVAA